MKRIEVIMDNPALDAFKQSAAELGILEFEVAAVQRSSVRYVEQQRLYRGQAYRVDLPTRSRVDFAVFDDDAERIVQALVRSLHPDSISILNVNRIVVLDRGMFVTDEACPAERSEPHAERQSAQAFPHPDTKPVPKSEFIAGFLRNGRG